MRRGNLCRCVALIAALGSVEASAQEATPAAPAATPAPSRADAGAISPLGATWRSAVVPGWGQRYKGEKTKGWVLTGAAGGLAALTTVGYFRAVQARAAYNKLQESDPASTFDARNREQTDAALQFQLAAGATAVTWLISVLDSGFSPIEPLRIKEARIEGVFPAGAKYFETNPLAIVSVENRSRNALGGVRVRLEAPELLPAPLESGDAVKLASGASRGFAIQGAFGKQLYQAAQAEEREIPAVIVIEYEAGAKKKVIRRTAAIHLHGRNAISWDDTRRAGSFVTPLEASVRTFASTAVRKPSKPLSPSETIATAAAIFDAMGSYGIRYLSDPATPFADISGNATGIDNVNFAFDTLTRKTGDCDDLTVLYSSLLESAGIPTAFVDVPGHIFVMFDTKESLEDISRKTGLPATTFTVRENGDAWMGVEVTAVGKTFEESTASASDEIAKWSALKKLNVVEVAAAQQLYPAGPPAFGAMAADFPQLDAATWTKLADDDERVASARSSKGFDDMIAKIRAKKLSPGAEANEIGVLRAQRLDLDGAIKDFKHALELDPKLAKALNNLGNIYYMRGQADDALAAYEKSLTVGGETARVLANIALLHYERGEPSVAATYFTRAVHIDSYYGVEYPELAALSASGGTLAVAPAPKPEGSRAAAVTGPDVRKRWIP